MGRPLFRLSFDIFIIIEKLTNAIITAEIIPKTGQDFHISSRRESKTKKHADFLSEEVKMGLDIGNGIGNIAGGTVADTLGYRGAYQLCAATLVAGLIIYIIYGLIRKRRAHSEQ